MAMMDSIGDGFFSTLLDEAQTAWGAQGNAWQGHVAPAPPWPAQQQMEMAPQPLQHKVSGEGVGGSKRERGAKEGSRSRRRSQVKGVSEQVAELEEQVSQQMRELQQQMQRKIMLTTRMQVLEQLISVKEQQEGRAKQVKAGLTFDPFEPMGTTIEEISHATPSWIVQRFRNVCQHMAKLLANVMPLLSKYPQLNSIKLSPDVLAVHRLGLPQPQLARLGSPQGSGTSPLGSGATPEDSNSTASSGIPLTAATTTTTATTAMAPGSTAQLAALFGLHASQLSRQDAQLLNELHLLFSQVHMLYNSYSYVLYVSPKVMLASAVHMSAVDACGTSTSSWDVLSSSLSNMTVTNTSHTATARSTGGLGTGLSSNSPTGSGPGPGPGPIDPVLGATVADESHWRTLVTNLKLTHEQRLQAMVLWEIISGARTNIQDYRAKLGRQMSLLLQHDPGQSQRSQLPVAAMQPDLAFVQQVMGTAPQQDTQQMQGVGGPGVAGSGLTSAGFGGSGGRPAGLSGPGHIMGGSQGPLTMGHPASVMPGETLLGRPSGSTPAPESVVWRSQRQVTEQEMLLRRMQGTLIKERCLVMLASEMMWRYLLSPVQHAMFMVHSHPFMPDELGLLHACAQECTPDVLEALVAAATEQELPQAGDMADA